MVWRERESVAPRTRSGWALRQVLSWEQADHGDYMAALFTDGGPQSLNQNPWVIGGAPGGEDGYTYVYNGLSFPRTSRPSGTNSITYLTDHHVIASGPYRALGVWITLRGVFHWNGGIHGESPASGPDWTKIIGDTPNAPLAKIAYASQMAGPNWCSALAIGPSRLWALDTAGNIYVAKDLPPVNNGK